jgi:hypothetical protein
MALAQWVGLWPTKPGASWAAGHKHLKPGERHGAAARACVALLVGQKAIWLQYVQLMEGRLRAARAVQRDATYDAQEAGGALPPPQRLEQPTAPVRAPGVPLYATRRASANTPLVHRLPLWAVRFLGNRASFTKEDFTSWARKAHVPAKAQPMLWLMLAAHKAGSLSLDSGLDHQAVREATGLAGSLPRRRHPRGRRGGRTGRRRAGQWGELIGGADEEEEDDDPWAGIY